MKKSLFALVCVAIAACAGWVGAAVAHVADVVVATGRAFKNLVLDGLLLAAPIDQGKTAAVVAFVQARAFVLRLIKRDRPVKSTQWSMCPST